MFEVEMTSLEIEKETGIQHNKIMRDVRDKWLQEFPLNQSNISLSKIGQSDFVVKLSSYTNSRGKDYPMYIFNKQAVNAFMANYRLEHAMKIVAKVDELEQELVAKQKEIDMMKSIVWEVINGQAYIGQEQALKMAGIKHPRLFMKYLKGNQKFYDSVVFERDILKNHQCNQHGDRWWKFTKEGFKWLLDGRDILNGWVEKQKNIEKSNNKLPC